MMPAALFGVRRGSVLYRSPVQRSGLASSSTGRNSRAEGPKFRKLWKGLRPADRDFEAKTGGVSTDPPANTHLPAPRGPLGGQLVEIGQGPSTSWSKSPRGACEPCQRCIVSLKFSNAPGPGEHSKPQGSARQLLPAYNEP
jgi:hypothetical protein